MRKWPSQRIVGAVEIDIQEKVIMQAKGISNHRLPEGVILWIKQYAVSKQLNIATDDLQEEIQHTSEYMQIPDLQDWEF